MRDPEIAFVVHIQAACSVQQHRIGRQIIDEDAIGGVDADAGRGRIQHIETAIGTGRQVKRLDKGFAVAPLVDFTHCIARQPRRSARAPWKVPPRRCGHRIARCVRRPPLWVTVGPPQADRRRQMALDARIASPTDSVVLRPRSPKRGQFDRLVVRLGRKQQAGRNGLGCATLPPGRDPSQIDVGMIGAIGKTDANIVKTGRQVNFAGRIFVGRQTCRHRLFVDEEPRLIDGLQTETIVAILRQRPACRSTPRCRAWAVE